ncbi:MAG: aminoacyl-tRNA hydrolase [Desulfobacterales bacterium]
MPQKRLRLVVGLGNPGDTYLKTRHNAGFMVVDEVAEAFSIPLVKRKFDTIFGRGFVDGVEIILIKPMAFMNLSGPPVRKITNYFRILCEDMLVIHDDIDLVLGRLKINEKGGDGGHKGVRSLMDAFGGGDFMRLRIGVGRPEARISAADYVLNGFSAKEKEALDQIITKARDAVVTILCKGTKEGMNRFNNKRILISS